MKGWIAVLAMTALLLDALPASSTTVLPQSLDELVLKAETIFIGEVVDRRSLWERRAEGRRIVTIVTFDVTRVLKGRLGLRTELRFLGGTIGDVTLDVPDMPTFQAGDRDVLFVSPERNAVSPLVGFSQGRFRVVQDAVTGETGSSVTVTWSGPTSGGAPTAYTIQAGSSSGLSNLANFSTGNTLTTFSASGVGSGVYYVRALATNSAGTSAASNEALLVVGGVCAGAPGAPSGLRVVSNSGGTVVLQWNAASGVPTSYIVEAGSSTGLTNLANSDLGSTSTSLTALGVGRGTYYARIRAKNAARRMKSC